MKPRVPMFILEDERERRDQSADHTDYGEQAAAAASVTRRPVPHSTAHGAMMVHTTAHRVPMMTAAKSGATGSSVMSSGPTGAAVMSSRSRHNSFLQSFSFILLPNYK